MIALRIPQNLIETNVRRRQILVDGLRELQPADLVFAALANIEMVL
jgi:hypothetical protein